MRTKLLEVKWLFPVAIVLMITAGCETVLEDSAVTTGEGEAVETEIVDSESLSGGTSEAMTVQSEEIIQNDVSAPMPGTQEDLVENVGDRVFFDYDSAVLTPEGRRTLERQAEWLRLFPEINITVEGHCDERGTREYNLALGERRAAAARDYLIAYGLNPNRLRTTSYGKERPYALGHDKEAWGLNRRSVTVVN